MYGGTKHGLAGMLALSGFRFGWLALAAATVIFVGVSLKNLVQQRNGLHP